MISAFLKLSQEVASLEWFSFNYVTLGPPQLLRLATPRVASPSLSLPHSPGFRSHRLALTSESCEILYIKVRLAALWVASPSWGCREPGGSAREVAPYLFMYIMFSCAIMFLIASTSFEASLQP